MKKGMLCVFLCFACQSQSLTSVYLQIHMLGVYEDTSPKASSGSQVPTAEIFTLKDVELTQSDGTKVPIYTDPSTEVRVIDRTRLIFQTKIQSSWVGTSFSALTVSFDKSVTGETLYNSAADLVLPTGEIAYPTAFSFSKGQGLDFVIKVQWKDTVTRSNDNQDTVSNPTFDVSASKI